MNKDDEKRIAAKLAKIMAMLCVRNAQLETLHAGLGPITRTGDYSDVFVVDADGRRIPWSEVSRIDENEMRQLMQEIVNRLYTFHLEANDPSRVPRSRGKTWAKMSDVTGRLACAAISYFPNNVPRSPSRPSACWKWTFAVSSSSRRRRIIPAI